MAGTFSRRHSSAVKRVAASVCREAFLLPLTRTAPSRRWPPSMRKRSPATNSPLYCHVENTGGRVATQVRGLLHVPEGQPSPPEADAPPAQGWQGSQAESVKRGRFTLRDES